MMSWKGWWNQGDIGAVVTACFKVIWMESVMACFKVTVMEITGNSHGLF
jgi:hypothetical protein